MTTASAYPQNSVLIENDLFECRIVPEIGGSIYAFDCKIGGNKTQPMLRHTKNPETKEILELSSWPIIPFSNRIKYGKFEFEGKKYEIAKSYLGGPNSIHASHGQGWQFPWKVEEKTSTKCHLSFVFDPNRPDMKELWPFPYEAHQHFELLEDGLMLRFSVKNTGTTNMPTGLGMHPYFYRSEGTTLQAKLEKLWEIDDEVIPVQHVPVPAEYEFSSPKSLDNARLDSCFSGYQGLMQIVWPNQPVALNLASSPELNHFVVYTPQGEDFFCAEPVSHKPNAINDPDIKKGGLAILAPGESMHAWYKYEAVRMPNAPQNLEKLKPWKQLNFSI